MEANPFVRPLVRGYASSRARPAADAVVAGALWAALLPRLLKTRRRRDLLGVSMLGAGFYGLKAHSNRGIERLTQPEFKTVLSPRAVDKEIRKLLEEAEEARPQAGKKNSMPTGKR